MKRLAALAAGACLLCACEQARQDMYDQPKYKPLAASALFADGAASRTVPPDTLAHAQGPFAGTSSGRTGTDAAASAQAAQSAGTQPYPMTRALLLRGQQRYAIYCLPCHSAVGDGDGPVVRRGFPAPPTYHQDRLRNAPDRHFYDVITHGYGIMFPYAERLAPDERWAVVAYIRALQLSQHANAADLPPAMRSHLPAGAAP